MGTDLFGGKLYIDGKEIDIEDAVVHFEIQEDNVEKPSFDFGAPFEGTMTLDGTVHLTNKEKRWLVCQSLYAWADSLGYEMSIFRNTKTNVNIVFVKSNDVMWKVGNWFYKYYNESLKEAWLLYAIDGEDVSYTTLDYTDGEVTKDD